MNIKIKVLGLVLDDENNILLIKEMVKRKDVPLLNAIRGTYDNASETPSAAVIRECIEEANAEVEIIDILPYHFANYGDRKIRIYLPFVCKLKNKNIKISNNDYQDKLNEQITEVKLFSKEEFLSLNETDFVEPIVFEIIQKYYI